MAVHSSPTTSLRGRWRSDACGVRSDLAAVLREHGGVADLAQLGAVVPPRSVTRAIGRGEVVRLLPRSYVAGDVAGERVRLHAAVLCSDGALSHTTALTVLGIGLALNGLPHAGRGPTEPVHVTVPATRRVRSRALMVVHRATVMPMILTRHGLPVVHLDRSLIDAWDILSPLERRAPVIEAVQRRQTTAPRIAAALDGRPQIRGARECRALLGLLTAGCHSEFEIWGCERVLAVPGLPRAEHQVRVSDGRRTAYLDAGWRDALLGVELDGAAWHADRSRCEADQRRDSWLGGLGWLVLRFSHRAATIDPERVRREIAAAYNTRRTQLHLT